MKKCRAAARHFFIFHFSLYSLFTIHAQPGSKFAALSVLRPPAGPKGPALFHSSLFTIHSYLFRQQGNDLLSCPNFGPLLFFSAEKKRSAPGWRRRRGFGADQDGPVLLHDSLVQGGKHGRSLVQTRIPPASLSAAAPLAHTLPVTSSLFTLTSYFREAPPWRGSCPRRGLRGDHRKAAAVSGNAPHPWLPRRRRGSWLDAQRPD